MGRKGLWTYCTKEQCQEMILSLGLLGRTKWAKEKQLACLYALSNHTERHYRLVSIPKRDGSVRRLLIPDPILMKIQKNILHHILDRLSVSSYATAYHKGAAILSNAQPHTGQKLVLKLDIRDFFGMIRFEQVYRAAFPRIYFPPRVAALLTFLCMCEESLPQGAPTSAAVSNLVMRPFDEYIGNWCGERGICYTRYCDDMTFSGDFDGNQVRHKAENFLKAMGFELNGKKTRHLSASQRQVITGVVVNKKPQVTKAYRRKLRQDLHYCKRYGIRSHLERIGDVRFLPMGEAGVERYRLSLLGRLHFVLQINPDDAWFTREKTCFSGKDAKENE